MLRKFSINDYKCLHECSLELKGLNLFSGPNSSGKSSAIQALLIASSNLRKSAGEYEFRARKELVATPFREMRNFVSNAKSFSMTLMADDGMPAGLEFTPGDDDYTTAIVVQTSDASASLLESIDDDRFLYLPAARVAGFPVYPTNAEPSNKLGRAGEYVIDYFVNHRRDVLDDSLVLTPGSRTLEGQVNAQLEKLMGYRLLVETSGAHHFVKFRTSGGKELQPYHVGTGVSSIADVVIVSFAAPKGGLIITENPEIHLHPEAQASLIDLMAKISKAGVQIIVESHSDHLFNGIRRLISKGELDLSDVAVYNFRKDKSGTSVAEAVEFTPQGGIRSYIPGMFEQFDKDLDAILGL